ncbi:indolepyruvate ferredoxin oxidoreductase beta subunit [Selenomonas sp. GACV-9]|uniref:indolepyruvate oxidoreductase subunit beta n=1 Tax=Selenomonas sp. GACV-9 TaxID=3158782 RepID=UPI0008EA12E7|nr:indolepyruvate ferredoxin oxidoreductase beta subunit [Selenomonas ruminantium]
MSTDIILCGVGGQGTILASKLIAAAAMKKGIPVKTAETIGMAQRGGSVFSHLRLDAGEGSPLIGKKRADLIIAFEPAEAVRQLPFLKEGGSVVVSSHPILPVSAMIGDSAYDAEGIMAYLRAKVADLTVVDSDAAARELGSMKVLNVVLLGAAVRSGALGLSEQDILAAIHERVPERFHALNEKALAFAR